MANFEVLISRIKEVSDHPNADKLSLVKIQDYTCISAKLEDGSHRYKVDNLVVYVPEGAVVPEYLLKQGFWDNNKNKGILAGTKGNRVKAIKLRDILSQGIIFPCESVYDGEILSHYVIRNGDKWRIVKEGDNVTEFFGIIRYEPEIPSSMAGEVLNIGMNNTVKYDIENLKKYPDVFREGEEVVVTEKLHGTLCMLGYSDALDHTDLIFNKMFVASKGLGGQGLVFKMNERNQKENIYIRVALELGLFNKLKNWELNHNYEKIIVIGEVFGKGVQDLHYGQQKATFRAFDLLVDNEFVSAKLKYEIFEEMDIESVPILYKGPFNRVKIDELAAGLTSMDGHNIKEGIVITSLEENEDKYIGRKILKHINDAYLLRKGGTEFN